MDAGARATLIAEYTASQQGAEHLVEDDDDASDSVKVRLERKNQRGVFDDAWVFLEKMDGMFGQRWYSFYLTQLDKARHGRRTKVSKNPNAPSYTMSDNGGRNHAIEALGDCRNYFERNCDTWMLYVSLREKPVREKADFDFMEMSCVVMYRQFCPFSTHMGISRNFDYWSDKVGDCFAHKDVAVVMHAAGSLLTCRAYGSEAPTYMLTAPMPMMRDILTRAFEKAGLAYGNVWVGSAKQRNKAKDELIALTRARECVDALQLNPSETNFEESLKVASLCSSITPQHKDFEYIDKAVENIRSRIQNDTSVQTTLQDSSDGEETYLTADESVCENGWWESCEKSDELLEKLSEQCVLAKARALVYNLKGVIAYLKNETPFFPSTSVDEAPFVEVADAIYIDSTVGSTEMKDRETVVQWKFNLPQFKGTIFSPPWVANYGFAHGSLPYTVISHSGFQELVKSYLTK